MLWLGPWIRFSCQKLWKIQEGNMKVLAFKRTTKPIKIPENSSVNKSSVLLATHTYIIFRFWHKLKYLHATAFMYLLVIYILYFDFDTSWNICMPLPLCIYWSLTQVLSSGFPLQICPGRGERVFRVLKHVSFRRFKEIRSTHDMVSM